MSMSTYVDSRISKRPMASYLGFCGCPNRRRWLPSLLSYAAPVVMVLSFWAVVAAQDLATILDSRQREVTRKGKILDYDADHLILQTAQGREVEIPSQRVIRVAPKRSADHVTADNRFDERDFKAALASYQRAIRPEKRNWVRRQMLAQIVRCYSNLGDRRSAASMFLILHEDDPRTRHFGVIPLTWRPWQPDRQSAAEATKWTGSQRPVARLIGASWLLSTSKRPDSIRVLELLKRDQDPRIQQLANTQL